MKYRTKRDAERALNTSEPLEVAGDRIDRNDSDAVKQSKKASLVRKIEEFINDNRDVLFIAVKEK